MKNIKFYLLFIIILIIFSNFTLGITYKINNEVDLKVPCLTSANAYCSNITNCTINILYPDYTLLTYSNMSFNHAYYNYTIPANSLNQIGEYINNIQCKGASEEGYNSFTFDVTVSGKEEIKLFPLLYGISFIVSVLLIIGFLSKGTNLKIFAYSFAIIEFIIFIFSIYAIYVGEEISYLLRLNFWFAFLIGIFLFSIVMIRLISKIYSGNDDKFKENNRMFDN